MDIEYIAVLVTLLSAFVGSIFGYIGARFQTKEIRKSKLDELAKSITELELELATTRNQTQQYSPLAWYTVIRQIIETNGEKLNIHDLEKRRDKVQDSLEHLCIGELGFRIMERPIPQPYIEKERIDFLLERTYKQQHRSSGR